MKYSDLLDMYRAFTEKYREDTYKHISTLLREAKEVHRRDWEKSPTPGKDHEQSWRSFKGKNLQKLLMEILRDELERLGLKMVDGDKLERTGSNNLSKELSTVKRNMLVDYGEFGSHFPDVDVIIYDRETYKIIAVISSKVTLRERIAQTAYWKIKLSRDQVTKHIKIFFVTPDEDGTLTVRTPAKKGRAIVEVDTDGGYVMSETQVEESPKVKMFDQFISDLRSLIGSHSVEQK